MRYRLALGIKYNQALKRRYNCLDKIDPIRLDETNVQDQIKWLMEKEEGGWVHAGHELTWGHIGVATGEDDLPYPTIASKNKEDAGRSASSLRSKGKGHLVDEESKESEEENGIGAYKECVILVGEDEPKYEDIDDL